MVSRHRAHSREEGVPTDLKYLPLVESGFKKVVSPAGAEGFWQFMKGTAKEYGLEVNENVDERYHVRKATRAACRYLKKAHDKYDSWTMAAASYNVGMQALNEQLRKQKADSYYELMLNTETGRYVYRILAIKEIHENLGKYGFHIREKDLYRPFKTRIVEVDSSIADLAEFAESHGTGYKELKILNPWLREVRLDNSSGKTYRIRLPKKGTSQLRHRDTGLYRNDTIRKKIHPDSQATQEK
ncbi:MAG: lytic transglycosylase domain-containing protein [Flavobacteriales bacterium]